MSEGPASGQESPKELGADSARDQDTANPVIARLTPKSPQVASGSRLRDHLANERTELAWIRTGVALITLGIAIDKFIIVQNQAGKVFGTVVIVVGLFAMIYSTISYVVVQRRIERDVYKPNFLGPVLMATVLTVGGLFALFWVTI